MKYTLLELTQDILSSINGDQVNSINDTVESEQVATVIRTAYYDLIQRANLPEHHSLRQLEETGVDTPVIMTIPEDVAEIQWVKYNWASVSDPSILMTTIDFKCLEDFLDMTDRLNPDDSDVSSLTLTVGSDNHTLLFKNSAPPRWYTTVDDNKIVFDSYDNEVETFLTKNNSRAYARLIIPFTLADDFTPSLDEPQFALLLNEAKSLAWAELRQAPHSKAEQAARRGWSELQKSKFAAGPLSDFDQLPNFGRKR